MHNVNKYDHLADTTAVEAVQGQLNALSARRAPALAAITEAMQAHTAAKATYQAALVSGNPDEAHTAREAVDAAARKAETLNAAPAAIEAAISALEPRLKDARNRATVPVVAAAIRQRLDAAKAGDVARKALAEAEQSAREANAILIHHGHGHPNHLDASSQSLTAPDGKYVLPTFAETVRMFEHPIGYFKGVDADGNERS